MSIAPGKCRARLCASLFFVLQSLILSSPSTAATTANVWQRWDQQLQVGFDYLNGGGNPYQNLSLVVQFIGPNSQSFKSNGFWDGGNTFRVRAAFPATGSWSWSVLSCSGLVGRNPQGQIQSCASDNTLMHQSGRLRWLPTTSPAIFSIATDF